MKCPDCGCPMDRHRVFHAECGCQDPPIKRDHECTHREREWTCEQCRECDFTDVADEAAQ